MALNFPSNPTIGDIYTDTTSGFSYEWDGVVQSPTIDYTVSAGTITFTTPPSSGLSFSGVWFRL